MKRVYSTETVTLAWNVKNLLEGIDIPCEVRNEFLVSGSGELPINDCLPEVWIYNDEDLAEASKIIENLNAEPENALEWTCPNCDELNEGQFSICWKCQMAPSLAT